MLSPVASHAEWKILIIEKVEIGMAVTDLGVPLLRSKIHRPAVDDNHIHRPSLLARLKRHRHGPLTLICAPAGYGKSTLASCWLASADVPGAWVSLDENDNDPRFFLAYVVAAIQLYFSQHPPENTNPAQSSDGTSRVHCCTKPD